MQPACYSGHMAPLLVLPHVFHVHTSAQSLHAPVVFQVFTKASPCHILLYKPSPSVLDRSIMLPLSSFQVLNLGQASLDTGTWGFRGGQPVHRERPTLLFTEKGLFMPHNPGLIQSTKHSKLKHFLLLVLVLLWMDNS